MSFKLKKLHHLFILWIFSVSVGYGQINLIPNPSFETLTSCPTHQGDVVMGKLSNWSLGCYIPNNTPDILATCASVTPQDISVPFNFLTRGLPNGLMPRHGNNYVHLKTSDAAESIKSNFTSPLALGREYKVRIWASLTATQNMGNTPINPNSGVEIRLLNTASGWTSICDRTLTIPLIGTFTTRGQWTLFEATFRVSDLMTAANLPIELDDPNNSYGVYFNFKQTFEIRAKRNGEGILIDDMSLTEVPCNLNPDYSYSINCDKKSNQAVIDVIGNAVNQNSQWILYRMTVNSTADQYIDPTFAPVTLSGNQAQFRVPNIAGRYYMIKHGVWESNGGCGWAEVRKVFQIPTFSNYVNSGFSHSHSGNTTGYSLTVNALDPTNPYSTWGLFASPVSLPTTSPNWYSSPVLLGVSGNNYTFTNLQYNMYYMVRHVSKHNCSDYGRTDQVFYISATGKSNIVLETYTENISLEEIEKMEKAFSLQNTTQDGDIKIYPNPAKEQVSISGSENSKVLITNQYGKVVYENNLSGELMINIANWKKGLYFVNIHTSERKTVKKLIVE
ncbi:hypothetical protein AD998_13410 [bacterium 336/3]|nr:hypothetical protein AD998_13410 [bacterium 336/3]